MDIQFFRTFLVVTRLGNMTQAAEELNFTQPTVTGQIRTLEQHFGNRLFDRIGKKLYITDAGRQLVPYAEKLLATYDEASKVLSVYPDSVSLGIATTTVNYILVPFLQEFERQAPDCTVSMEMCPNTPAVVKGLHENRFDLGFVQNGVAAEYLTGFEIYKVQLVWVVHPKLAEKHNFSTDLLDYPLLGYKKGGLSRTLCEQAIPGKPEPRFEYSDAEAMKNAILQGLGCGALPAVMIGQALQDGTLREFAAAPRPAFSVWVAYHRDKTLSRAAQTLIKILQGGARPDL